MMLSQKILDTLKNFAHKTANNLESSLKHSLKIQEIVFFFEKSVHWPSSTR